MKRERVEDLGIIYQMMLTKLDDCDWMGECASKHTVDEFIRKYKDEEKLADLHDNIRWLNNFLYEVLDVARGDEE